MSHATRPGDVLGERYRLVDLLLDSDGGRFWRAHDRILERHVSIHVIGADDARAPSLMEAARRASTVNDRRVLRVLDAEATDEVCYVVNEWGWGASLDIVVNARGPLKPRTAAWLVSEVAESVATAHASGHVHGRLNPENVLVDRSGGVRIIGLCVDAALHGVDVADDATAARRADDVTDLAGLLYCALTATWTGASASAVAAAPREHGQHGETLRPRQVRAGIPKQLDSLCDEMLVLHAPGRHRELVDLDPTAAGIAGFLADFVGDPVGMPEALLATAPVTQTNEQVVLPPIPDPVPHDADDPAGVGTDGDAARPDTAERASAGELPTEAGVPIFDESRDDVAWLARRSPTAPPPPFESHPERPLFAPEPSDGGPVRRPREGAGDTTGNDGFWPFDDDARTDGADGADGAGGSAGSAAETTTTTAPRARAARATRAGRGRRRDDGDTGTTVAPAVPLHTPPPVAATPASLHDAPAPRDGRRSPLRVAGAVAAVLLLVVAAVAAYTLTRDDDEGGGAPGGPGGTGASEGTSAPPAGAPLTGLTATAFDPVGGDGENDEEAANAVDGDPATAWTTDGYNDQIGTAPTSLKPGVGLVIDLDGEHDVREVDLRFLGSPTDVSLYVLDDVPTGEPTAAGLTPDAEGTAEVSAGGGSGTADLTLDVDATGTHLLVWLTALPDDGGDFRGALAELVVRGG